MKRKLTGKHASVLGVHRGKMMNKSDLCKRFDLDASKPLFSFIGRLVYEKGADLFPSVLYKALLKEKIIYCYLDRGISPWNRN